MFKRTSNFPVVPKDKLVAIYRKAIARGASLATIEATVAKYASRARVAEQQEQVEQTNYEDRVRAQTPLFIRLTARILPFALLGLGTLLLSSALVPIASYYISPQVTQTQELSAPVPITEVLEAQVIVGTQVSEIEPETTKVAPVMLMTAPDYTNLNNWLPQSQQLKSETPVDSITYELDIPKLELEDALVTIGGTDLKSSLVHYPGTAEPGDLGSPVIFGHSVLRQFYNPSVKNPNRYNSIFSTIMTLVPGDKIYLTRNNTRFIYEVIRKTDVKPEDTYILQQKYDARLLKLVTCTPEGTYLRRGVVTAQLVDD